MTRLALAVPFLALALGVGSAPAFKQGGIFLVGTPGASSPIDPQIAYASTAWWLEYATAAKLYNYPDEPAPGGALLRPEVASGFTVSAGGRTYTFTIRPGFRFSDGSPVTARNFAYAISRALDRKLGSPAAQFITDPNGTKIVRFEARGAKLVIRLARPDGAFLSKITMPFFQATSTTLPRHTEVVEPYPSAGPYYFARQDTNVLTSIRRNPYWHGDRPRALTGVEVRWNENEQTDFLEVLNNDLDLGPIPPDEIEKVARRFGVNRSRFWSMPVNCAGFMSFNNVSGIFAGNPQLRRAVNWVVDRQGYVDQAGPYTGGPWTHLLPAGVPGSVVAKARQPYGPRANVAKARRLAAGHMRDGKIIVVTVGGGFIRSAQAELVRRDLIRLGFDPAKIDMRSWQPSISALPPEWDLLPTGGWCAEYPDPYDFFLIFSGSPEYYSTHFDSAKYARKIKAASKLVGASRYRAFGKLDLEMMEQAAPIAPMRTYNNLYLFSNRVDPRSLVYQPVYADWSIPALALK